MEPWYELRVTREKGRHTSTTVIAEGVCTRSMLLLIKCDRASGTDSNAVVVYSGGGLRQQVSVTVSAHNDLLLYKREPVTTLLL